MKNIIYDEIFIFGEDNSNALDKAVDILGCAEYFERVFDIDLCFGDGYYSDDLDRDEAILEKYDGLISNTEPFRYRDTKKVFDLKRKYRFTITDPDDSCYIGDYVCYINGQMVNR